MDDGPGIRTTVFLKGCPLRCIWCHNAEGLYRQKQLAFTAENCTLCRRCQEVCPAGCHQFADGVHTVIRTCEDKKACIACGKCAESCPGDALRIYGRTVSAEEVLQDVEKDRLFYETSEGGMTLSGGEPFSQSDFALELLEMAKKRGLHTCVETSGYCRREVLEKAAAFTDLFLFDIKETDPTLHFSFTGVDNELILSNLKLLADLKKPVILRCPLIPGCNDREAHLLQVAKLAEQLANIQEIHLEPYHPFGLDKYEKLGMKAAYQNSTFMEKDTAEKWLDFVKQHTCVKAKIS